MRPVAKNLIHFGLIAVLSLALGCSDDPPGHPSESNLEKLAGGWEIVTMASDTLSIELPPGNAYRYFDDRGASCELWRTAYGYMSPGNEAQVDEASLVMTVQYPNFVLTCQLVLSSKGDTLQITTIAPDSLEIDTWSLVKVNDAPEATCFE